MEKAESQFRVGVSRGKAILNTTGSSKKEKITPKSESSEDDYIYLNEEQRCLVKSLKEFHLCSAKVSPND